MSYFFSLWNIVFFHCLRIFIIVALMSLSAKPNIWTPLELVSSEWVIDCCCFLLSWTTHSCFFACLILFWLKTRHFILCCNILSSGFPICLRHLLVFVVSINCLNLFWGFYLPLDYSHWCLCLILFCFFLFIFVFSMAIRVTPITAQLMISQWFEQQLWSNTSSLFDFHLPWTNGSLYELEITSKFSYLSSFKSLLTLLGSSLHMSGIHGDVT